MLTLLLNPKNLLIAALAVALGLTWIVADARKHKVMEQDTKIVQLQENVKSITVASESKQVALDSCADNLKDIQNAYEEMKKAAEQTKVYRKKWKQVTAEQAELPPPTDGEPCLNGGKIDEGHKTILAAAVAGFNSYIVRGKVSRPGADSGGGSAPPVLPPASAPAH